jgi:putative tryptophan/tyrosine transport system substrate-binding protein
VRRRAFIALVAGAAVEWPLPVGAQKPERTRHVGLLIGGAGTGLDRALVAAFRDRLDELGWKDGNLQTDIRWWTGGPEQMRGVATDMLAASPDVIVAYTNLALATLMPIAGDVPIVFVGVGDPVASGFVASLARPGRNITGFASYNGPMGGKWLEILKEAVPQLTQVRVILHPETPVHGAFWQSIEVAAPSIHVEATRAAVHDAAEIEQAILSIATKDDPGLIVLPHAITAANRDLIVETCLKKHLPAIHADASAARAGALMSYALDFEDSFRHTAEYVDRILRGERAADLAVQQPVKFLLTLNLKSARALGISIPSTLLARADEVIE